MKSKEEVGMVGKPGKLNGKERAVEGKESVGKERGERRGRR